MSILQVWAAERAAMVAVGGGGRGASVPAGGGPGGPGGPTYGGPRTTLRCGQVHTDYIPSPFQEEGIYS